MGVFFNQSEACVCRTLRRPGQHQEKTNRTMILAPLVGIILNLMDCSSTSEHRELNDVIAVFASMDCPTTIHFGLQYLLSYNWVSFLSFPTSPFLNQLGFKFLCCFICFFWFDTGFPL